MSLERYPRADEAKTLGSDDNLTLLQKLLALEVLLVTRLESCSVRETAGISRELRDCWREIEGLHLDSARSEPEDDELARRRERVARARESASKAGTSS